MLASAVCIQPSEQLSQDVMLPLEQQERLACVLSLAVSQNLLEEVNDAKVLRIAF